MRKVLHTSYGWLLTVSHRYVATLEARIQTLERQLRAKKPGQVMKNNEPSFTPDTICPELQACGKGVPDILHPDEPDGETPCSPFSAQREQIPVAAHGPPSVQQPVTSDIIVLDMLHGRSFTSDPEQESLPALPSSNRAKALVDTVYFYTQARYCIIDWTQLREWHRDREAIAYTSTDGPLDAQTGAYFIWIIYAIGACLVANPETSTEVGHKYVKFLNGNGKL